MRFFVTSSGTDCGKTFFCTVLLHQARTQGWGVQAFKPIISGFNPHASEQSDTAALIAACGNMPSPHTIEHTSPWRFAAPLSPHMAAEKEGRHLSLAEVSQWCNARPMLEGLTLFEGAGGVLVPLNEHHTIRDLIKELSLPTLVVVGSYLGSISHSLTAIEALQAQQIPIQAVIVSESPESTVSLPETVATLRQFAPAIPHIVALPRVRTWQEAPDLLHILA